MSIYRIKGPWPGTLSIVSRPRGGDWLAQDVQRWKDAKLDAIVSLLTTEEQDEFELEGERDASEDQSLRFFSLPITDLGVPSSRKETVAMLSKIEKLLLAGRNVGVHCRQSVGRSGMIAASLLVLSGSDPREAFESVSKDRGLPVPETNEQRDWVIDPARELEPAVIPG
jgi:Polymorphic toxin system, DSP-PTPase phosphatase